MLTLSLDLTVTDVYAPSASHTRTNASLLLYGVSAGELGLRQKFELTVMSVNITTFP